MAKQIKNPLTTVTATIMYYMKSQELTNKAVCEKLMIAPSTWIDKKNPEKFTLGDLNILSKIFGIDMVVLVGGLTPRPERSV